MWANFLQPLKNGNYIVDWKIIGTDGHPIEGTFSFSVEVPMMNPRVKIGRNRRRTKTRR